MVVNDKDAFMHYTSAAYHGIDTAKSLLANKYFSGLGVKQNSQKALDWYEKVTHKTPEIYYQLGMMYETGVGTKINIIKAIRYYLDAEQKGSTKALLALARIYQYGIGIDKNIEQAIRLYNHAAKQGSQYARFQLAKIYLGIHNHSISASDALKKDSHQKAMSLLESLNKDSYLPAKQALARLSLEEKAQQNLPSTTNKIDESMVKGEANMMYIDAIKRLNQGREHDSKAILKQIVTKFPGYEPAKMLLYDLTAGDEVIEQEVLKQKKILNEKKLEESQNKVEAKAQKAS